MQLSSNVLPPDFENRDHITYGYLYVDLGKIAWFKGSPKQDNVKIKVKFWGDKNGQVMRPVNAARELQGLPTALQYEIRCPLVSFHKYLEDCSRLKFFILDARNDSPLGNAIINLQFYLKHSLTKNDLTPLNEVNDNFPIFKLAKPGVNESMTEKIGQIEIKMTAAFLAQTSKPAEQPGRSEQKAQGGLLASANDYLTSSFLGNEMRAKDEANEGVFPADLYAPQSQQPDLMYNRDTRIPKSLIPSKEDNQYNAEGFKPQQIFGLSQQSQFTGQKQFGSPGRANQSAQKIFDLNNPAGSFGGRPGNDLSDKQMDDQLEKIFLRAENLYNQISNVSRVEPRPHYNEPSVNSGYLTQPDPDTQKATQSLDLVKQQFKHDIAMLIDDDVKKDVTEDKNAPKVLTFDMIDSLKIKVLEFVCENVHLREKINDGKIFVECLVPSSASSKDHPIYDTYKFFSKGSESLLWYFNNEITQNISKEEGEFKKLFNHNIIFKLYLASHNATGTTHMDLNFEIASGELSVEKVILSPGYAGTFYIKLSSKVPLGHHHHSKHETKDTKVQKKGTKTPIVPQKTLKPAGSLMRSETVTEVGDLKVVFQFASSQITGVQIREEKPVVSSPQKRVETSFVEGQFLPLQALLYAEKIPKISGRNDPEFPFRNLYIAYKLYGTPQRVKSEVRWKTNTPFLDHRMMFPIGREQLPKMYDIPLILEVWDKREGSKDELVGLVTLNLEAVPRSLIESESGEINYDFLNSNQFPIIVYDDAVSIVGVRSGKEVGQIQLTLAVGTPLQVSKFESKVQQKRNQYAEFPERMPVYSPSPPRREPEESKVSPIPEKKHVEAQSKPSPFDKYKVDIDDNERVVGVNSYEAFVEVMERIRKHTDLATIKSKPLFMSKERFMNVKELSDFFLEPSFTIKSEYSRKTVKLLDIEKRGMIFREYFTRSYQTYVEYEEQVRRRFSEIAKNLRALLSQKDISVLAFEKILNSHSEFGFIKKSLLKETFEKLGVNLGPKMMEFILALLDYENNGFVFISHLTDYLKALEVYDSLNYLNLNPHFFIENVSSIIKDVLRARDITKEKLDHAFQHQQLEDQVLRIDQAIQILLRLGCDLTFWESLSLLEHIKIKMNVINSEETRTSIQGKVLYTWLYLAIGPDLDIHLHENEEGLGRSIREPSPRPHRTPKRSNLVSPNSATGKKRIDFSHKDDEHNDSFNSIDDIAMMLNKKPTEEQPPEQHAEHISSEREEEKHEEPKPEEKVAEEKPKKLNRGLLRHVLRFSINGLSQLNLGQHYEGDICSVKYVFPSTQDLIESNTFEYSREKQDYEVDLASRYTWNLGKSESLLDYLRNDSNGVLLQLVKKGDSGDEVVGYTILPIEEIAHLVDRSVAEGSATKAEGSLEKVILLFRHSQPRGNFSFQSDLVIGKLSVVLEYERGHPVVQEEPSDSDSELQNKKSLKARSRSRETRQTLIEKETSIQRQIPKKGYFIFRVEAINELKRGLGYLLQKNQEIQEILENKFDGGAKLAIHFDLFWQDKNLKNVVPPFEIELPGRQIDFDEIFADKSDSKYVEMTSEIIDYIQHKSARVEVRLYFEKNDEEPKRDSEAGSLEKERTYVVVCGSRIPLLPLIISDTGVKGDFPLTNNMECYCGLISLQITLNKENKVGFGRTGPFRGKEKTSYVTILSFNELLNIAENEEKKKRASDKGDSETIFYIEFEVEGETKRSSFYSFNKWNEKISLEDCFFIFTVEATSEFFKKPLEIKILKKKKPQLQDKVLGLVTLDFFGVFKKNSFEKKSFIESFYCPVTDVEKAKTLKTRLGVKAALIKAKSNVDIRKLNNYLNAILKGDLSRDSKKFKMHDAKMTMTLTKAKLKETFKQETKLTYGELDDLSNLLSEESDIVSWELFTKEVRPDLQLEAYLDPQSWKSMLEEFVFYDYSGEGFITFENAKALISYYSEYLNNIQEDVLERFKVSIDLKGLQMGYPKRLNEMFDYVVFLTKLERLDRREQYRRIHDNTRKVDAFISSQLSGKIQSPSRRRVENMGQQQIGPVKVRIEFQYGKNFQQLNHGKPPSSFVRCELGSRASQFSSNQEILAETQVISRSSEPEFNYITDINIPNFDELIGRGDAGLTFKVFHRSFNANYSEQMHKVDLIGEGFLSMANLMKEDWRLSFNDFVEIQPVLSGLTLRQTARAMIKVNITGEPSSAQTYNREREYLAGSYEKKNYGRTTFEADYEDEIPELNQDMIDNVARTLAEVNRDVKSLGGSAEKARKHFEDDHYLDVKEYDDFDDLAQSHKKTREAISEINKGLDDLFKVSSPLIKTGDYRQSFGNQDKEVLIRDEEGFEPETLEMKEQDQQYPTGYTTGSFAHKLGDTNPFEKNLSPFGSTQQQRRPVNIPQDIRNEMPYELQNVATSSVNENQAQEEEYKIPSRERDSFKQVNKENDSLNKPSEPTEKNPSSGLSGSKPPVASSTSSVKRLEQKFPKSMRNSGELERIARIMKSTGDPNKKPHYSSSDSD